MYFKKLADILLEDIDILNYFSVLLLTRHLGTIRFPCVFNNQHENLQKITYMAEKQEISQKSKSDNIWSKLLGFTGSLTSPCTVNNYLLYSPKILQLFVCY